jgi:Cu(I)/Ag(I) efflux system membrane protein CusA/SilA
MLEKIIDWSLRNVRLVLLTTLLLVACGIYTLSKIPLDALPDLSDTQVIIYTEYSGQAPQVVEDQVSYPLATALLGIPHSRVIRGFSYFGVSFIYVIFEDGIDASWARSKVLEYLNAATGKLPQGVTSQLGPDTSGAGWVYQYAVLAKDYSLAELRTLQDWFLHYSLSNTQGVAEVASLGGFVRQYQVTVDPGKLQIYGISPKTVIEAIRNGNRNVGGRVIELAGAEYMVRGRGYLRGQSDLNQLVLKAVNGVPITIRDVARVELVPDERRGIAELNGEGEAVSGIALARDGQNVLQVIQNLKKRLEEIATALPDGVSIQAVYDRSLLIHRAIASLSQTLLEESGVVAAVCALFLVHVRSALVAILILPIGILISFVLMSFLGMSSNIMSLGGIAIAIGAMVDAAIVMIENTHKHLERDADRLPRFEILSNACREVGPPLFFSLLVITVSFLPVFALGAQEGRLFQPLALTKTFAMAGAALLSITLAPALMLLFVRGKILQEQHNPINRLLLRNYRPALSWAMQRRSITLLLALLILAVTWYPATHLGGEYMPILNEGTLLFMPQTPPGLSVTEAAELLQTQDRIIKSFPEVESVFGKAGRAMTATDPAPLEMMETLVNLKPESEWRSGLTMDKLIAEMDQALQLPGVSNTWTMPIKNRIDMLATGIRSPIGIKLFGKDLMEIEGLAREIELAIKTVPGTASAFAERITGGYYLNIDPDYETLARHGVSVSDLQDVIATAIGGETVTTLVEGRERIAVIMRYPRELRDTPEAIATHVLVPTSTGKMVPLGQVARLSLSQGPSVIRTENAMLTAYIYVDIRDRDIEGYVRDAKQAVEQSVHFPPGYHIKWSGQFENMERAKQRLWLVVPLTLAVIFILLYMNFGCLTETMIVMLAVPFALVGGVWLVWYLGYNFSIAVGIGFIALAGVAAETGVVMLIYLDQAFREQRRRCEKEQRVMNKADLHVALMAGAAERLRPKAMTVVAIMAGLLPIMWSHDTGSEVIRRIAAPMVGGMISSSLLTLIVIPVAYTWINERSLQDTWSK